MGRKERIMERDTGSEDPKFEKTKYVDYDHLPVLPSFVCLFAVFLSFWCPSLFCFVFLVLIVTID